jgi:REP element-mobilizing transposase RayT
LHRLRAVWIKNPIYFLTCCTVERRPVLTTPAAAEIIPTTWREAAEVHGWIVCRHVIMPDHVHFFARARVEAKPLSAFMRDWKKWTARKIVGTGAATAPLWQPEFFEHVLRSSRSYSEKGTTFATTLSAPGSFPRPSRGRMPAKALTSNGEWLD